MLKKIGLIYNNIEEIFLVLCIAVMVVVIFMQVLMRYAFNNSLYWSEELARFLFVWVSWIGISLGQKKGEHIVITLVADRFKGKANAIFLAIGNVFTLAILVVLFIKGVEVTDKIASIATTTAALHIDKWLMYLPVPISCFLMTVRVLKKMILNLSAAWKQGEGVA
jgi:TRAP-type C4-dicarboxylate transport system permease small subunit